MFIVEMAMMEVQGFFNLNWVDLINKKLNYFNTYHNAPTRRQFNEIGKYL